MGILGQLFIPAARGMGILGQLFIPAARALAFFTVLVAPHYAGADPSQGKEILDDWGGVINSGPVSRSQIHSMS